MRLGIDARCYAVRPESDAEAKLVHDLREDGFLTLDWYYGDGRVVGLCRLLAR